MQSQDVEAWYEDMGWYYEDDLDMIMAMAAGIGPDGPECVLVPADKLDGLADLFGAELAGWTGVSPMHDAVIPAGVDGVGTDVDADAVVGAIWAGTEGPVRLRVPEGMVTKPWPGAVVLGQWSDRSGSPSRALPLNAAIVLNGTVMYVGADLLSWDALQEEPARALAANIVRFMLGVDR